MLYHQKVLKLIRVLNEKRTRQITTCHTRPFYAKDYNLVSDTQKVPTSLAIVMQGQLLLKNNFTLETISLYKKIFPKETVLIVSTWKDSDATTVQALRDMDVIVLLNEKPKIHGIGNINAQIISTKNGIEAALEKSVHYILKTRTDVRIYAPNAAEYLEAACNLFPIQEKYSQKKRIVALSVNSYKYRPYSISDLTLFGTSHDIKNYFAVKEDNRTTPNFNTIRTWSQERFCEVYLSTHFLEKVGRKLTYTLEDSWGAYADHFCVVDASSLDFIWYKYSYWKEYRDTFYRFMKNNQELTFREWLILYTSILNKKNIPENILDETFGTTMNTSIM